MTTALAVLVALAPGALVWGWGRRLVRSAADPALPERVHAWRRRSIAAAASGAALLLVFLRSHLAWALPLLLLGFLAGGFPVRRGLLGETWGLGRYLLHSVRAILAFAGFWVLILTAPGIIAAARPREWMAAAALAGVLLVWGFFHDRILLRLLRARPLDRPDLEPRLTDIAARSSAPMPRLFAVGAPGGRWANGMALPSTGRPAVAFTRTLLEMLEVDEIAAIFAHEQAHLEHFDRRRVLRLGLLQALVVLLGTFGAAAALGRLDSATLAVTLGWPLVVGVGLVGRLARHQAHEADSDRRAAELCGDPGALARGLVKLHELALFPRRLELEREQWESHPSLASRLRALRSLAGEEREGAGTSSDEPAEPPLPRGVPVGLAGTADGVWLVLEGGQAHWLEGVPEGTARDPEALRSAAPRARSLAYAELVELRLEPRGDRHRVVATDRAGASWTVELAPGEVEAAQGALDAIDAHLSPTSAAPRGYRPLAALVAAAGALVALLALSAAALPGLVAVVLSHPGPLAALGTALVVSVLVAPPEGALGLLQGVPGALHLGAMLALGAAALVLAWVTAWKERAGRTRSAPWVGLALSLAAAVPLLPLVAGVFTGHVLAVHLAARQHPAGAVLLAGAAAAFLVSPRAWSRRLGVAAAILAVVPLTVGSTAFAHRFVRDPLWVNDPPALPPPVSLRLVTEHSLPPRSNALELSPSGRSVVVRGYEWDQDRDAAPRERLVVGPVGEPGHPRIALDVALLDDERLVALEENAGGLAVICGPHVPSETEEWRHALSELVSPRLAVSPGAGLWRVAGVDPDSGELVRLVGDLDGEAVRESRWPAADLAGQWLVSADPTALGVGLSFDDDWESDASAFQTFSGLWWLLAGSGGGGGRVFTLDAHGPRALLDSQMTVQCDEPPPGRVTFVCRAHAGERTVLWSVDPSSGERLLLGVIRGFATPARPAAVGGVVLTHDGRGQVLYRLGPEGPERIDRPEASNGSRWILDAAGYTGGVGVLGTGEGGPRLRLYTWADAAERAHSPLQEKSGRGLSPSTP